MRRNTKGFSIEPTPQAAAFLNIQNHPGYEDAFTRDQHPLAEFENGARVVKLFADDGPQLHPPGTLGTVLGSIGNAEVGVAYFVEFDPRPRRAVLVHGGKLKRHA